MPEKGTRKKQTQARPEQAVWGAYKPDIFRSYPDPPVRGRIVDGRFGKEFRPDPGQLDKRRHPKYDLKDWITGSSYDTVIEVMRETADDAIKELRSGIDRLQRFIDNN